MNSVRKRAREEDISIRVAAGEPVAAESLVLRTLSSCARALPADAQEWDVSGLLAEDGQPFSRETVSCWLQCGYRHIYSDEADLDADCGSQLSTVAGLTQVLAFADAVGSFKGLCMAACSQLPQLKLVVQLPEQQALELQLAVSYYYWQYTSSGTKQLTKCSLAHSARVGDPLGLQQRRDVRQQVAQQLAALLRLAHVLRLQPLLDVLHRLIMPNAGSSHLLCDVLGLVFTDAVLEAALGSSSSSGTLSREAYVSSVLSQPCSFTPGFVGHASLLKPTGPRRYDAMKETLEFDAVLLRDFAGGMAGETVKVTLNLFGATNHSQGVITLASHSDASPRAAERHIVKLPAQLLLGCLSADTQACKGF